MNDKPQYLFGLPVRVTSSVPESEMWMTQETWEGGKLVRRRHIIMLDDLREPMSKAKP